MTPDRFETWLRTQCFQKPTPEAHSLAKAAWCQAREEAYQLASKLAEAGGEPEIAQAIRALKSEAEE